MSEAAMEHAPVRVVAPILFATEYVVGALMQWRWPLAALQGAARWAAAAALAATGLAVGIAAIKSMRRAGTSPNPYVASAALVEAGPYRVTRNPMYVSMVLVFAGLSFAFRSTWSLALLPLAALAVDRWVIVPEERYLLHRFGDAYAAYRARVRRWI